MSNQSAISRVQANLDELFKGNLASGNAYIKFQLASDTNLLLSMEQVQESLIVEAEQVTTLPGMPESVIGMMSSRDHVFCIFDLAQLLKLPSWSIPPRQYQIIVLQTTTEPKINLGFAVSQLQGIIRLSSAQIQSPPDIFSSNIAPYVSCVASPEAETMIPILEFNRILEVLTRDFQLGG